MALFERYNALNIIHERRIEARQKIDALTEAEVLSRTPAEVAAELTAEFVPDFPTLHVDETHIERTEETITRVVERGYGMGKATFTDTVQMFTSYTPVTGDTQLLNWEPSSSLVGGVQADIVGKNVAIKLQADEGEERINAHLDRILEQVLNHIDRLRSDFRSLPDEFLQLATEIMGRRKEKIEQANAMATGLRFPLRVRQDAPDTYRPADAPRTAFPILQVMPPGSYAAVTKAKPSTSRPEPFIEEAAYQHILKVMDNMTAVMEHSPHAFRTLGEEDIRFHFLIQLNGQYEGQATGETFNFDGKTDILIRADGRNVFIAECKFWGGEKLLLKTVDQLLGYLTWRDAKTALVIFNQNKNLSGVISTIRDAIPKHASFRSGPRIEGETRLRYRMTNPRDKDRELVMTVMVYDVPRPE